MSVTGAKPVGVADEAEAARAVQQMFDSIAPRYDLLNHILSASVDRLWWWQTARKFKAILADPDAAVLDICCGTGHMTMALLKGRPRGARPILAADFSRGMLSRAATRFDALRFQPHKASEKGVPYAVPLEADALHLPLRDASLDPKGEHVGLARSGGRAHQQPGCERHDGLTLLGRQADEHVVGKGRLVTHRYPDATGTR